MKTLALCNLVPNKRGAFEEALIYEGKVYRERGDSLVLGLAGEPIKEVADELSRAGVRWHILPGWADAHGNPRGWQFFKAALRLLAIERPDTVSVSFNNEIPSLWVSLMAPMFGFRRIKWVWIQHQQIRDPGRITRWISRIRLLSLRFNHFIATYEGGRESLRRRGIPDSKITIIRNSVSDYVPKRSPGWLRRELNLSPETILLVTIGSLIERKRIDFILRAFADLELTGTLPLHLVIVGEGPEREKLQELARALNLAHTFHFLGLRSDVGEILGEAAVYLHAATAETGTYAIIEAMAARLPVVVTDAGAARLQVVQGETGYVLEPDDFAGYCGCLTRLVMEPAHRQELGQAARRRWEARYRLEDNVGRYHDLYLRAARK